MNPDAEQIRMALAERLDLEALYLCGPFDEQGEPASPDIHILAVVRHGDLRDFHFMPGIAGFERRVEVSTVGAQEVAAALRDGVTNWAMFYTVDKLRRARPISESEELRRLRQGAVRNLRIRPTFYSAILRSVCSSMQMLMRHDLHLEALVLSTSMLIISVLSLHAIAESKASFSRHSDMLETGGGLLRRSFGTIPAAAAGECILCARRVLGAILRQLQIDSARFLKPLPDSTRSKGV